MANSARIGRRVLAGLFALFLSALIPVACGSNISLVSPDQPDSVEDGRMVDSDTEVDQHADAINQGSSGDSISLADENLSSQRDTVTPRNPEFGEIIFAPNVTESYQPVDPSFVFAAGITQVHAVFEYSGMSGDNNWERVWYLNEQEISRSAGPWTDPGSGIFDYSIDNGGERLPPGDWILELYVDGELRSLGVFIIEEE
jgi:hypothetical protein